MALYDEISAGIAVVGAAITGLLVGVGGAALKTRRTLAKDSSDIKQERSNTQASTWLNEQLMEQVTRSEARHEKTIEAARDVFSQREADVEKIARQDEQIKNCLREIEACRDRAQRAETRAAIAEEHMRVQTEQMLSMSINIARLTTALARHDAAEAARLSPQKQGQPLLVPPQIDEEGPS